MFAKLNNSFMSKPDNWNVVSSANNSVRKFVAFGKSFINSKKRSGPKTEPWGTPQVIFLLADSMPFIETNCSLSLR